MSYAKEQKKYHRNIAIIGAIIISIIGILILISPHSNNENKKVPVSHNQNDAQVDYEKAQAEVIKSTLNLYFAYHGEYPTSTEQVIDDENIDQESRDLFEKDTTELNGFDYKVKGDYSAYTFTYLTSKGDEVTEFGDYKNEYH